MCRVMEEFTKQGKNMCLMIQHLKSRITTYVVPIKKKHFAVCSSRKLQSATRKAMFRPMFVHKDRQRTRQEFSRPRNPVQPLGVPIAHPVTHV